MLSFFSNLSQEDLMFCPHQLDAVAADERVDLGDGTRTVEASEEIAKLLLVHLPCLVNLFQELLGADSQKFSVEFLLLGEFGGLIDVDVGFCFGVFLLESGRRPRLKKEFAHDDNNFNIRSYSYRKQAIPINLCLVFRNQGVFLEYVRFIVHIFDDIKTESPTVLAFSSLGCLAFNYQRREF